MVQSRELRLLGVGQGNGWSFINSTPLGSRAAFSVNFIYAEPFGE